MILKIIFLLTLSFHISYSVCAHTIVHTSKELQNVMAKEQEVGIVFLDGDWFQIDGAKVNMGGKIMPYGKRKPVLTGSLQTVNIRKETKVQGGYWTASIAGNGAADFFFLNETFDAIERVKMMNGKEFMYIKASDLQRMDKATRSVKIKILPKYAELLNKNESYFKNATLKVGYWFVQMNIYNLKSDDSYLYGQIDNEYNYNLLDIRPNASVLVSFFNFPFEDGGIYIDENDELHVPVKYSTARIGCSDNILTLYGERKLTIEGITFAGSMNPIEIKGANKHIYNCYFKNCGRGVYCDYGVTNKFGNCSVSHCHFENLYNNDAITFVGCDDVVISNNTIHNTGIVNKGGSVIRVGGDNFKVEHNNISCYSYIAINANISRNYAAARMAGSINNNLVDNAENWGQADKQLTDGGGIYVLTHTDGVIIENNIVRNIGYDGCELWGIYLDDGAYNCTVRRNLVYNLWPGQYAMTARYVDECERSCMNNCFENNIFIGPCKIAGNRKGFGNKTIIRNNYIGGDLNTQGDEYVYLDSNKYVSATIKNNGKIFIGRGVKIKKSGYTHNIKKLISK